MKVHRKFIIPFLACGLPLLLNSCSGLSYYGQSIAGQLEILRKQQPITRLIGDPRTDPAHRERLLLILELRNFASADLRLPDNDSYRSFADLNRRYVVWNVIAAPEFSLEPVRSCFPIAGCLPYRGYFAETGAKHYAEELRAAGFDVFLGGVTAYSTLGWFDDPVLSTMLNRNNTELARVMFHELAHQQVYIRDDTEFNEAFADAVAWIGVLRRLRSTGDSAELGRFEQQQERQRQFIDLVQEYRRRLQVLYSSHAPDPDKRREKSSIFDEMRADYRTLRAGWGGQDDYASWFDEGLNNARFAALLTYQNQVPDFLALYDAVDGDLDRFYARVAWIGSCPQIRRRELLRMEPSQGDCSGK